jgi:hypothetical protein
MPVTPPDLLMEPHMLIGSKSRRETLLKPRAIIRMGAVVGMPLII